MCKFNPSNQGRRIDPCMKPLIKFLKKNMKPVSCCCGHGKYPMTVVIQNRIHIEMFKELFTDTLIPRQRRFYKRDENGYYYIPESIKS